MKKAADLKIGDTVYTEQQGGSIRYSNVISLERIGTSEIRIKTDVALVFIMGDSDDQLITKEYNVYLSKQNVLEKMIKEQERRVAVMEHELLGARDYLKELKSQNQ